MIALAVADFDNDGIPDVVTNGGYLLFFRGTGAGTFEAPTRIPFLVNQSDVIFAADFDRDGNMDIAVPGWILLGDGHGGFTKSLPMPLSGDRMVAGDFDGDGILDIAMLDYSNALTILHGVGDGTVVIGPTLIPGNGLSGPPRMLLQSADFNRDGVSDIVVATPSKGAVEVILGSKNNTFVAKPLASSVFQIGDVTVGDFNNDGRPDIAFAAIPSQYQTFTLFVFPGLGDGSFATSMMTPTSYYDAVITTGDFDGDGKLDLVFQGWTGEEYDTAVYLGKGNGTFRDARITRPLGRNNVLTAADVHRDGKLDLLLPGPEGYFTVLAGTGDGYFAGPPLFPSPAGIFGGIAVADLNGDGVPDLVGTGAGLSTLIGDGDGGFLPMTTYSQLTDGPPVIGDFDGDGMPDVAVSDGFDGLFVFLNQGDGTLGAPMLTMKDDSEALLAAGDFDGDGKLDLVVYSSGVLSLYRGLGNGSFQLPSAIATPFASQIVTADVNGDGEPDILALSSNLPSTILCFLGYGDGTFAPPVATVLSDIANSFAVGDFDEDGKLDIVVQYSYPGSVGIRFGDKTGNFSSEKVFPAEDSPRTVTAADVNGDGHLDVISTGAQVAVLSGTGTGTLGPALLFGSGGFSSAIGDFNQDGKPDIAIAAQINASGGCGVRVLTNTGCEPRRLGVGPGVPVCTLPGGPLSPQAVVTVYDDGDNVVSCDAEQVVASIASRTGTSGAILGGTKTINVVSGVASFSNLSIDRAGTGYKFEFHHPTAAPVRSSAFDIGGSPPTPAASNNGPICSGQTLQLQTPVVARGIYHWTGPNGFSSTLRNPTIPNVTAAAAGIYNLTVEVDGCESGTGNTTAVVRPSIVTPITAPASACPYAAGYVASVPDAGPGATYSWSISNGTITAGLGTPSITFSAGNVGQVTLSVLVVASAGCAFVTTSVDVENTCGMSFYTLPPCRIVDTRNPTGAYGAPALGGFHARNFILTGQCGIPPTAFAVSANVTVTQSTAAGDLRIAAGGTGVPIPWVITYSAGQTRANNAILALGASGDIGVYCDQFFGTAQFILDVNGYFQ